MAVALGIGYLAYDVALTRGIPLPGGDLRPAVVAVFVGAVLASGTLLTWLLVPQPTGGRGGRPRRSGWSAALGLFAAVPIAYLVLVVEGQILRPLLA